MQHVGVKAFERLKLTNVRNREAYECEWRPCQHALPTLHRWCNRRVLYTEDEAFFAHALRKRGLTRDELYGAPLSNGLASCCHAIQQPSHLQESSPVNESSAPSTESRLQPGGAILALLAPTDGSECPREHRTHGRQSRVLPSHDDPHAHARERDDACAHEHVLASLACVIAPGGSLSVWVPAEEVRGLLELLHE